MPARLKIRRDSLQSLMRFAKQPFFFFRCARCADFAGSCTAQRTGMPLDQPIRTVQKAPCSIDAFFAPLQIFFGWRRKQRVKTARICTVFVSHFMRADDVAFRLRHCRATLQYHSLRKESGRGIAVLNQSKIANYLEPETGGQHVQYSARK